MLPFLIILAAFQTYMDKEFKFKDVLNRKTILTLFVVGALGDMMSLCHIFAG